MFENDIDKLACAAENKVKAMNRFPRVYQNKCVNGIYKKLKNNLVSRAVSPLL